MKNLKFLLIAVATSICFTGCYFGDDDDGGGIFNCVDGDGAVVTEIINVPDFKGIQLNSSIEVYLKQGTEQKVEIEGQQNIIDLLELDVQDEVWDIEFDRCIRDFKDVRIYITSALIDFVAVSGSGNVYSENELEGENIELRITGSGDIDLALLMENLDAKISGSGQIDLEGKVTNFGLKISASGDYNAFELETENGDVTINGSGDVEVLVNQNLEIKINGSGDIDYTGYPLLDIEINGSGDVNNAN